MILFTSLLEIINVVVPNQNIFWRIAVSVADVAAVNPNLIKTLLANALSTFFIRAKPVFSNGSKCIPKNPPDCPFLCSWVLNNLILPDKLFAKALQNLKYCILVNNNLCQKLFSSLESPTTTEFIKLWIRQFYVQNVIAKINNIS